MSPTDFYSVNEDIAFFSNVGNSLPDYAPLRHRSSKRKQSSEAAQSRESVGKDSRGISQDRRLKRTAVIREERWTSGVASSRKEDIPALSVISRPRHSSSG
jgi:hypothetical protein